MKIDRRTFLKAVMGGAAALALPPTLEDNAEAARRFTVQLDRTHLEPKPLVWNIETAEPRPDDWFNRPWATDHIVQVQAAQMSQHYRFRRRAAGDEWGPWVSAEMLAGVQGAYELALETPARFNAGVIYECQVQTNLDPVSEAFQSTVPAVIDHIGWRV